MTANVRFVWNNLADRFTNHIYDGDGAAKQKVGKKEEAADAVPT